jgi:hypothetical protein
MTAGITTTGFTGTGAGVTTDGFGATGGIYGTETTCGEPVETVSTGMLSPSTKTGSSWMSPGLAPVIAC